MPGTTPRGFPYPLPTEPVAEGAQAIRNLAESIDRRYRGRLTPAQFQALTNLVDGDEVDLVADTASGTVWRLRYNAAGPLAYKWEAVGGPDLVLYESADVSYGPSAFSPVGPLITVPRPGYYNVRSCSISAMPASAGIWHASAWVYYPAGTGIAGVPSIYQSSYSQGNKPFVTDVRANITAPGQICVAFQCAASGTTSLDRMYAIAPVCLTNAASLTAAELDDFDLPEAETLDLVGGLLDGYET